MKTTKRINLHPTQKGLSGLGPKENLWSCKDSLELVPREIHFGKSVSTLTYCYVLDMFMYFLIFCELFHLVGNRAEAVGKSKINQECVLADFWILRGQGLRLHTLFQIQMAKIYTLFQTTTTRKPYPLAPHILYNLCNGVSPLTNTADIEEEQIRPEL